MSLKRTLLDQFPSEKFNDFVSNLPDDNTLNWRQFTELLSAYEVAGFDNYTATVTSSTTWGICQEYLGNYLSNEDLEYLSDRGGHWHQYIFDYDTVNPVMVVSIREVLDHLKFRFPVITHNITG